MTKSSIVAKALIFCFAGAALLIDLSMLPSGDRLGLPDVPQIYIYASLVICAAALSLNLRTTRAAIWTAVGLSFVLLAAPAIAWLQGVEVSMIMIRRSWLIVLTWAIALSSTLQRQREQSLEATGRRTARALERLEGDYTRKSAALATIASRDRSLEARLEHAQQLAGLGSWEQDLESGEHWWSDEIYRQLGLEPGSVPPDHDRLDAAFDAESRSTRAERIQELLTTGAGRLALLRMQAADGTPRYFEEQYAAIRREDGCVVRIVGTMHDVTRQHRLESEVSSLNEKLLALIDVSFDGFLVVEHGVIVEASDETASKLGYTSAEVIGLSPLTFVAPAFREFAEKSTLLEQTSEPTEIGLVTKSGELVFAEYFATNVRTDGRQFRVIGLRDIADRVSTERAMAATAENERNRIGFDLHDHVGQVLVGTKWAAERLVAQLQRIELEDPAVLEQATRVSVLVAEAIGEVRRVSSRLAPRVLDSCDIQQALKSLCLEIDRGDSRFECRLVCSYKRPLRDRDTTIHLFRIAEEAVTNSVKHSRGRVIDVRFGRDGDVFVLDVVDDGIGIPAPESRGEGVGLRSMRHRARLLGGTLEIAARAEGGTHLKCVFRATTEAAQSA